MLIDFSFKNFRSFKKEVTLSMMAAKSLRNDIITEDDYSNITEGFGDRNYLRVASIYGANASGKSTVIKAMSFFKAMILTSVSDEHIIDHFQDYFLFDDSSCDEPTSFEMNFVINGKAYRYGFEILHDSVYSEWLFETLPQTMRESYCFKRERKVIKVNSRVFKGARGLDEKTRHNALFLSTTAQFNVATAMEIKEWFRKSFNILSGLDETLHFTANQFLHDGVMQKEILEYIKLIDLGIQNITISDETVKNEDEIKKNLISSGILPPALVSTLKEKGNIRRLEISSFHNFYKGKEDVGQAPLPFNQESLGTQKTFSFLGPWFDTLRRGGALVVDEFGTSLHTQLAKKLLQLFQSRLNKQGAQLIITTHDTNLLHKDLLRRDQIWFTEKDRRGYSDLYSLVEYKINQASSVRNDATFSKDYLAGKYGAIPFFGNIDRFIKEYSDGN